MNFVECLNMFGIEAKEIPCIKGSGAPTTATVGAVGLFYMNTANGDMYKCTEVSGNSYTWKSMSNGKGISYAQIDANGNLIIYYTDNTSSNLGKVVGNDGAKGKDGTSVTVTNVSTSTADGGNNVVTFSDGKILTVKNGSKGSKGDTGATGATGSAGADGFSPTVSVSSITGGHKVSITDKNGTKTFDVMDGEDGKDGAGGSGGGEQADWNASEGEAGYVLNRTHYEEYSEEVFLEKTNLVINEDGQFLSEINTPSEPIPTYADKEFAVWWNGVEYKCKAFYYYEETSDDMLFLGNYGAVLDGDMSTEPFVIVMTMAEGAGIMLAFDLTGGTEAEVSVVRVNNFVSELPKKFIQGSLNELKEELTEYPISFTSTVDNGTNDYGVEYKQFDDAVLENAIGKTSHVNVSINGQRYDFYPVFSESEGGALIAVVPFEIDASSASNLYNEVHFHIFNGTFKWNVVKLNIIFKRNANYGLSNQGKILVVNENGYAEPEDMPKTGIDKSSVTLGVHTDGLVYVFVDGTPCGTGISMSVGGNTDVVGNVDDNNNIVITGYLPDGEYTLKYAYTDGTTSDVGSFVVGNGTPSEPSIVNLANPSDATWLTNKRYNSSLVLTDVTDAQRGTDTLVVTNLIDITSVDVLHVKNLDVMSKTSGSSDYYSRVYLYDDTGALITYSSPLNPGNSTDVYSTAEYDESVMLIDVDNLIYDYNYKLGEGRSFKYFSVGGILTGTAEDVIITADQQIV